MIDDGVEPPVTPVVKVLVVPMATLYVNGVEESPFWSVTVNDAVGALRAPVWLGLLKVIDCRAVVRSVAL